MPSPVTSDQICECVPSPSDSLCRRIDLVLLRLPKLLCTFWGWMLNGDATFTTDFKNAVSHFSPGDAKFTFKPAADDGWLRCEGQTVKKTDYPSLWTAIGDIYGPATDPLYFKVPDMRGRSAFGVSGGVDASRTVSLPLGTATGADTVSLILSEMPAHHHTAAAQTGLDINAPGARTLLGASTIPGEFSSSQNTSDTGGGAAHSNLPPCIAGYWIIKT